MSLKTGIVGCGKVGDFHAKAYSQLGSSAFAAVCDADLDRARAFAERYHVRAYADVAEMIQTEGLDVVSNSQNPALYDKVHIFGENGAGVGVQTDGGAMFIAGMSAIAEPPGRLEAGGLRLLQPGGFDVLLPPRADRGLPARGGDPHPPPGGRKGRPQDGGAVHRHLPQHPDQ